MVCGMPHVTGNADGTAQNHLEPLALLRWTASRRCTRSVPLFSVLLVPLSSSCIFSFFFLLPLAVNHSVIQTLNLLEVQTPILVYNDATLSVSRVWIFSRKTWSKRPS